MIRDRFFKLFENYNMIAVVGARQAGKTTFLKKQMRGVKSSYLLFDDPDVRELFEEDVKKFERTKFTKIKAKKLNSPLIKECPINIECKLEKIVPLGSHDLFIGRIICVDIDEELMGIWSLWDKAVGNVIAENTRPYAVKGKLLMVNVISSTWMHHLQFLKKDMTNAINGSIGKTVIEDIIFKIGPI